MFNDRFAQLIARKLSGEATEQEVQELEVYLEEDPQAQIFFEVFSDYWTLEPKSTEDDIQQEVHFQQIIAIAEKEPVQENQTFIQTPEKEELPRIFPWKRLLVAASVTGILILSYFLFVNKADSEDPRELAVNEVSTTPAAKTQLILPDGSKVWLNSESKLEYKGNFNDSVREVTLEGEAFFDVVKDKTRPFIVHTSDIDIRVLGTAFNVKSYPRESSIEATLIHGLIEITNKKEPTSPKVILRPHEKLVFNKQSAPVEMNQGTPPKEIKAHKPFAINALPKNVSDTALVETSWIYNKLIFDGETLRENAAKMERWYNVKIRFKGEKVGNEPIRYPLQNETIEEALRALQYIEPFNYKKIGNQIEISKK